MSYLGYPRLHFSGQFQTNPSTVNNDPYHFNTSTFTPNDQLRNSPGNPSSNGWWNPDGSAYWRFYNCEVKSVCYKDRSHSFSPVEDSVIGMKINGAENSVNGRLVDLDPEQQMVSQVWGFKINIGGKSQPNGFTSDFKVAPFIDIWARYPQGHPDSFFSAFYQSVLENIDWSGEINSRFIKELKDSGKTKLSIKFVVDGYNDDFSDPDFTYGRVVGIIGPYEKGEPEHFVNARCLRPVEGGSSFSMNYAYATIEKGNKDMPPALLLDLSNSLLTVGAGKGLVDYGTLELGYLDLKKNGNFEQVSAISGYTDPRYYLEQGAISSFILDANQARAINSNPLAIRRLNKQNGLFELLLSENNEGAFMRADNFVFRLEPGEKKEAIIYANQFGKPASGVKVNIVFNNSLVLGQQKQGPISGPPAGTPESALKFDKNIKTNRKGVATLPIKASNPGNPRGYIDGQVYGIQYSWDGIPPTEYNPNGSNLLSLLVFDEYKTKGKPCWLEDVRPIMQQYADLYPVMKNIMDLGSYHDLVKYRRALQLVFSRPVTDANYMPVTRDLSEGKKNMLMQWLADEQPLYMKIQLLGKISIEEFKKNKKAVLAKHPALKYITLDDLKLALQTAIELEHATLPPYLTAYFSIMPGANRKASDLIRSVLMEEMLHMSLACNLLNAIGGSPEIDKPGFVPTFPSELPGSLRNGLTIHLKKCSLDQIRDAFMAIEEPDDTEYPDEHHTMTIGWFYHLIAKTFEFLVIRDGEKNVFVGNPKNQLTSYHPPHGEMIKVTNLKTAMAAIEEIVEQGEGATPFNPDDGYHELAHYYKFEEIVQGRELVIDKEGKGYSFTGAPIPFDENAVYNMVDDPGMHPIPKGSAIDLASKAFNQSYTNLLKSLHKVFNGDPDLLAAAVGQMFSLTVQARQLMQMPLRDSKGNLIYNNADCSCGDKKNCTCEKKPLTAGPAFRYYLGQ